MNFWCNKKKRTVAEICGKTEPATLEKILKKLHTFIQAANDDDNQKPNQQTN